LLLLAACHLSFVTSAITDDKTTRDANGAIVSTERNNPTGDSTIRDANGQIIRREERPPQKP
jgi:hypothetical protein